MIILPMMSLHRSPTEIKEEQEKRQQHFAYATLTTSSSIPNTDFNFAAVGDWECNPNTADTIKNIQNKDPELVLALGDS